MLTVPHVYQLLLKIGTGSSWKDALLEVLPKKKLNEGIKTVEGQSEGDPESGPGNHDPDNTLDENTEGKSENESEESPENSWRQNKVGHDSKIVGDVC